VETEDSLLNDQRVIKEIREELTTFLEANENECMTCKNPWDCRTVLRGKLTVLSAYIKKSEQIQINNLMMHLKLLEKQKQDK
jgi:hypothetical protein